MKALSCLGAVLLFFALNAAAEDNKWVIHEWGTFTSLQDETGAAIGGINTDDEPVPVFVHRLANFLLLQPTEMPYSFCQGAPACHPDVTMRLETPVIYFHRPPGQTEMTKADVQVKFRGGWLTEYYPDAEPTAPGLRPAGFGTGFAGFLVDFGPLHSDTVSTLAWNDVSIGGDWPVTNTSAHVWTSPRAVLADSVQAANGESEKFLFYRGVAHIPAPLRISHDTGTGELFFRSQLGDLPATRPLSLHSLWLIDIHPGGKVAFRALPPIALDANSKRILTHTPADFDPKEFSSANLKKLNTALKTALVENGLFSDEADALLNTWELSYFKSAGLRVFFLVPRAWTDFYLPLEISLPANINRVMVGRIELVTPEQRSKLAEIRQFSAERIRTEVERMRTNFYASSGVTPAGWQRIYVEGKPLAETVPVPHTYQTYLDLGRFRNALVLDEEKRHPSDGLTSLISAYRLEAYKPVDHVTPLRPSGGGVTNLTDAR